MTHAKPFGWVALAVAALSACATPAPAPVPAAPGESYRALGQEPGWALTIADGWIYYQGDYGETRISAPRPEPRTTFNGHRYETPRLTVDVTHTRCNDAMSGFGFPDTVTVTADGKTVHGCGGERRTDWDM